MEVVVCGAHGCLLGWHTLSHLISLSLWLFFFISMDEMQRHTHRFPFFSSCFKKCVYCFLFCMKSQVSCGWCFYCGRGMNDGLKMSFFSLFFKIQFSALKKYRNKIVLHCACVFYCVFSVVWNFYNEVWNGSDMNTKKVSIAFRCEVVKIHTHIFYEFCSALNLTLLAVLSLLCWLTHSFCFSYILH